MKKIVWLARIITFATIVMHIFDLKRVWGAELIDVNSYVIEVLIVIALCLFILIYSFLVDWEEE